MGTMPRGRKFCRHTLTPICHYLAGCNFSICSPRLFTILGKAKRNTGGKYFETAERASISSFLATISNLRVFRCLLFSRRRATMLSFRFTFSGYLKDCSALSGFSESDRCYPTMVFGLSISLLLAQSKVSNRRHAQA